MLFNSISFLIFFPIVCLVYFLIPPRGRYIWLLVASYYFYMSWNVEYAFLLFGSTFITYIAAYVMDAIQRGDLAEEKKKRRKKLCVAFSLILNLAILFFFKYFNFTVDSINALLGRLGIEALDVSLDVVLPVGISFYIFQALGYTIDVYRGETQAEKNFLRYALFVSFFPQLVAGPIERSKNLLRQLGGVNTFSYERMRDGLLLMVWGYFMKVVIADRIAIFVDAVYGDLDTYGGWYVIIASVLFAVQIYCDFAGYSTIAMGAARVMGYELMENFNCPYFSRSVAEFWRRWHISLSTWFKDYLYIPLGGNRKGIWRKYLNLMIVFLVSGFWHGANWTYVIWGGLNGVFQVLGSMYRPLFNKLTTCFHLRREAFSHKLYNTLLTFVLIDFSWIFFRASTVQDAFKAIKSIFTVHNPWILFDGSLYQLGLDQKNYQFMWLSILILLAADYLKYRGIVVRERLQGQEMWFRWGVYIVSVLAVLVFGIYGYGYDAANFIYFQF